MSHEIHELDHKRPFLCDFIEGMPFTATTENQSKIQSQTCLEFSVAQKLMFQPCNDMLY